MLGIRRSWIYNFSRSLSAIAKAALSTILIGEDVKMQEMSQQPPVSCLQQSYHCYWGHGGGFQGYCVWKYMWGILVGVGRGDSKKYCSWLLQGSLPLHRPHHAGNMSQIVIYLFSSCLVPIKNCISQFFLFSNHVTQLTKILFSPTLLSSSSTLQ